MKTTCEWCGVRFEVARKGRLPRFCSSSCRGKNHRARTAAIPERMRKDPRWVRAAGKRPITVEGRPASSTNANTWSSWREVQRSKMGDGFGFMLGGGVGAYDLDNVTDAQARAFIKSLMEPVIFVERSVSGRGIHVFVETVEAPGSVERVNWFSVEKYSRARFIRVTGEVFV